MVGSGSLSPTHRSRLPSNPVFSTESDTEQTVACCSIAKLESQAAMIGAAVIRNLPSWALMRRSLKVAFAMVLASSIALVPFMQRPFGYWGPLTVAFIAGNNAGSSFMQSLLRFVGTVIGSAAGFFIISLAQGNIILTTILLTLWTSAVAPLRLSPYIGYAGTVGSFTAGILNLSNFPVGTTPESIALARIEVTVFAIAVYLFTSNFIFPITASEQAFQFAQDLASRTTASFSMAAQAVEMSLGM